VILLGVVGLAWNTGAALPVNATRLLVGAWETDVGLGMAIYQFDSAGTFTLTFDGRLAGKARGRWSLQGDLLVMENTASDTPLTIVGDKETAQIVGLDDRKLMLKTTDGKGRPEVVTLTKAFDPTLFPKGKAENPKIVGFYRGNYNGNTLVLLADGSAVFSYEGRTCIGQWSQAEGELRLRTRDLRDLAEMVMQERVEGIGARSMGTTRPSSRFRVLPAGALATGKGVSSLPTTTTRPAVGQPLDRSFLDQMRSALPAITGVHALPPIAMEVVRDPRTTTRPTTRPIGATTQAVNADRFVIKPYLVELTYGVVSISDKSAVLRLIGNAGPVDVEYTRLQP